MVKIWRGSVGGSGSKPTRIVSQIVDHRDLKTGYTAMQRTVAYTMSIGAQMIMDGRLSKRGIVEPSEVPFKPFATELCRRGLDITRKVEHWDGSIEPGGE